MVTQITTTNSKSAASLGASLSAEGSYGAVDAEASASIEAKLN